MAAAGSLDLALAFARHGYVLDYVAIPRGVATSAFGAVRERA